MYYTFGILSNAIYHNNKLTGTNIVKSELKNMVVSLNYLSFLLELFVSRLNRNIIDQISTYLRFNM